MANWVTLTSRMRDSCVVLPYRQIINGKFLIVLSGLISMYSYHLARYFEEAQKLSINRDNNKKSNTHLDSNSTVREIHRGNFIILVYISKQPLSEDGIKRFSFQYEHRVLPEGNPYGERHRTRDVLNGFRGEFPRTGTHRSVMEYCYGHQLCQIQKLMTIICGLARRRGCLRKQSKNLKLPKSEIRV
jgi:hypothetical protein